MADKHPRHHGPRRASPSVLERINPNAAGIDCGSAEHYVAVPPERDPQPVQSFKTFTKDLVRCAPGLRQHYPGPPGCPHPDDPAHRRPSRS